MGVEDLLLVNQAQIQFLVQLHQLVAVVVEPEVNLELVVQVVMVVLVVEEDHQEQILLKTDQVVQVTHHL